MKTAPKTFYEVEKGIVHCEAANGQDYTLCGFTLDGDMGEVVEGIAKKITCGDCLGIIRFCASISKRSLPVADQIREPTTGRYAFDGKWERLCTCGHKLGAHIAGGFECGTDPNGYPETRGCNCQRFRPSRKRRALNIHKQT